MKRKFYIELSYAVAAIVSVNGKIIDAAPIFAWMKGKTLQTVKPWLLSKKAKVIEL